MSILSKEVILQPLFLLRIAQFVLGVIVLALGAAAISKSTVSVSGWTYHWASDTDSYAVFVGVWTIVAIAYLIFSPVLLEITAHPLGFLIVEGLSHIFWFANWIALAAQAGKYGTCHGFTTCQLTTGNAVISAFTWLSFCGSTYFVVRSAIPYFRNRGLSTTLPGLPGGYLPLPPAREEGAAGPVAPEQASGADLEMNVTPPMRDEKADPTLVPAGTDLDAQRPSVGV